MPNKSLFSMKIVNQRNNNVQKNVFMEYVKMVNVSVLKDSKEMIAQLVNPKKKKKNVYQMKNGTQF